MTVKMLNPTSMRDSNGGTKRGGDRKTPVTTGTAYTYIFKNYIGIRIEIRNCNSAAPLRRCCGIFPT